MLPVATAPKIPAARVSSPHPHERGIRPPSQRPDRPCFARGRARDPRGPTATRRAPATGAPPPAPPPPDRRRPPHGVRDRPGRADQTARPARREGRREVLHPAALGADAGQQEDRPRHQLARPLEVTGLGRSEYRADVRQIAGLRPAQSVDDPRQSVPQRAALGELQILDVAGARVRRPHEHEDAGAGLDQRQERVDSEQRVRRERVCAERGEGLRVDGGRDRDVSPFAVGYHQQPGGVGMTRRSRPAHSSRRRPNRSKQAS